MSIHKCLLNEDGTFSSLLRMQLMVFVAASDFNHSSDPTFQSDQFGEGQSRTILPSTPVPDHVSGGLSSCWSLCEAVVSAYFEPVFSGTTNTESHSAILHHSALFQGKGWAGSPLCQLVPTMVPGQCEDTDGDFSSLPSLFGNHPSAASS